MKKIIIQPLLSCWAVVKADRNTNGTVVQRMEYYPSGLQLCNNTTDSDKQMRRYNGKELDRMHGLNTYDYGARQYNPVTARWDRMDPLCEKYYGVSPYAYCGNNPMNRIDPDGRDVVIVGPLANMALLQLQERIGNDVKLFLTNDNYLCYDIVGKGNLNKSSQTLIEIIDNSDITVNITTTDKKETSSGALLVGGAFMGTNVELDANGNVVHTTAYQEVNPQVLNEADKYSSKGTFMMHELTEAYEGAKISAKKRFPVQIQKEIILYILKLIKMQQLNQPYTKDCLIRMGNRLRIQKKHKKLNGM